MVLRCSCTAIRAARASERHVVGAYHSHPTSSPVPSARDLAEASFPEFVYLIISPGEANRSDRVRAYRLADGRATAITIVPDNRKDF